MKVERVFRLFLLFSTVGHMFLNPNIAQARTRQKAGGEKTTIDVSRLGYLTAEEREKIAENGFVVFVPKRPGYHPADEALSIYHKCKSSHFPVFVTSDVILHTSHLLFDWSLRFLETSSLKDDLLNLTDVMLTKSLSYYDEIRNKQLKEAALKNAIFFNVAKCVLTQGKLEEVPKDVKVIIEKERKLIDEHPGFWVSPLFGYKEDYSQYVPRGHYSRSPEFERYFKAMVWYGRMGFRLTPLKETQGRYVLDEEAGLTETLQAILVCKALSEAKIKGETALAVWERIYETTSFFAGRSDDLTVKEYKELVDKIYGQSCPLSTISNEERVAEFVKQARRLRKPKILSIYITDISSQAEDWRTQTQALRFMGQRFAPDSQIFQNLVYDKVKWYTGKDPKPFTAVFANGAWFRGFPRGLDIMGVFGSEAAEKILEEEKDADYKRYKEQFSKLKEQHDLSDKEAWTRDLYCSRLWSLKSILDKPDENAPWFMQSEAWLAIRGLVGETTQHGPGLLDGT
ncbi:MAG: DUF3160 domain-containing protein [Planctomycetota bacterium]|jgi:hypothetical protein